MSRYVRSGAVFAADVLGAIVDGVLDGGLDDVVLVLGTLAEVFGDDGREDRSVFEHLGHDDGDGAAVAGPLDLAFVFVFDLEDDDTQLQFDFATDSGDDAVDLTDADVGDTDALMEEVEQFLRDQDGR